MAHLLSQANKRGLRRIIVVLPFTNIITQSVETYRKALTLTGENPELIVAELHHRAEFSDVHSRQFTALWRAPIIVTTAVAFFETLASNTPSTMRKLHNLPGSAVFVDESHAALPAKLLPLAWRWIKTYAHEWSCHWVLASGSLSRFWKIEEFDQETPDIPEIIFPKLSKTLQQYENKRISYRYHQTPLSASELVQWTSTLPGPRLLIVNTVQSAAVIAREFERQCGKKKVEHISTALMAKDRANTLERVKSRLGNDNDSNWTLVATSCVEAGVDLSFKTGIREAASLVSLLQTAGRVNRHGTDTHAEIWTFKLTEEGLLKCHPGFRDATSVLTDLISSTAAISQAFCTEALKREIRLSGTFKQSLIDADKHMQYPQVEKSFRVIPTDTRLVIVEKELIEKLEMHLPVNWREIQNGSVQIWEYRLNELRIPEISGRPGLYKWNYDYDNFIGYMAGILPVDAFIQGKTGACFG
jgi:CRISPR/Cas system-associated endonuclease/helicase Cas3